jgi:hypothetical protein
MTMSRGRKKEEQEGGEERRGEERRKRRRREIDCRFVHEQCLPSVMGHGCCLKMKKTTKKRDQRRSYSTMNSSHQQR